MKFTFTDSAIEYILKQINKSNENTYDIIIDYTDGNSPYNENISGCHCQVYDKYRVLIVSKNDVNIRWSKYDKQVESNLGGVYFPSYYEMMFDKNNVFDYKDFTLNLKSEAGIIADQVQLIIKL
jgi:hypothetical protein